MSIAKRWPLIIKQRRNIFSVFIAILIALTVFKAQRVDARPLFSAIAIDGYTGRIVHSRNADSLRYPASLTKVMTLYLLFGELKAGRISKSTRLYVSRYAASRPPSKLGLKPGSHIRVETAILALVTKSANDVATTIAESLAGSEKAFARRMTKTARRIGMSRTTFRNASGLPDKRQRTTARDMSKLAQRIQRDFPQYYHYFRTRSFRYGKRTYGNHNKLLRRFRGTDGIKTGYTRASGYNLISSARRGKKKVIAVVMGGRTGRARDSHMMAIMGHAFKKVSTYTPRKRKPVFVKPVPLPVAKPRLKKQPSPVEKDTSIQNSDLIANRLKPSINPGGPTVFASATPISLDQLPPLKTSGRKLATSANGKPPMVKRNRIIPASTSIKPTVLLTPMPVQRPAQKMTKSGWTIQIGAFVRKGDAMRLLDKTQLKARSILAGKAGFTTTHTRNDKVIYRARFAGFTKLSALNTCRALKQHDIGCYTLAP